MQGDWMINLIVSMITLLPGAALVVLAGRLEYSLLTGFNTAVIFDAIAGRYIAAVMHIASTAKTPPATRTQATADAGYPSTTQH